MKAKLIKHGDYYAIIQDDKMVAFSTDLCTNDHLIGKLSQQNCDEIFGVVDVDKLADELKVGISYKEYDHLIKRGIIVGFNKAMELNKDKVFTLEDMRKAYEEGYFAEHNFEVVIQSLQQPTEIEVEIEMDSIPADRAPNGWDTFPKLDSEGCLILKKI